MGAGLLNTSKLGMAAVNASDFWALVDPVTVPVNVNIGLSVRLNDNVLNGAVINGIVAVGTVSIQQVNQLSVQNGSASVVVSQLAHVSAPLNGSPVNYRPVNGDIIPNGEIVPELRFQISPNNANVVVVCPKIMVKKGQGGHLFITVETEDEITYRFSFEGVKA